MSQVEKQSIQRVSRTQSDNLKEQSEKQTGGQPEKSTCAKLGLEDGKRSTL
jgi:hypothetical protein